MLMVPPSLFYRRPVNLHIPEESNHSCGQSEQAFGSSLYFLTGCPRAESRLNLHLQHFLPPRPPLVGMAGPAARIVPRTRRPIHQCPRRAPPRHRLCQGERPEADGEAPDVRPNESPLLLARPDDFLAVAEGDLQREAVGHGFQNVGYARRYVGAEIGSPA